MRINDEACRRNAEVSNSHHEQFENAASLDPNYNIITFRGMQSLYNRCLEKTGDEDKLLEVRAKKYMFPGGARKEHKRIY